MIDIEVLFHYVVLAVLKIIDNIVTTEKSILINKNKAIGASVLVIISQFLFYFLIKEIVSDNNAMSVIIVSLASGVGSYIAFYINKKFSKETVYINIVTSNDKDLMKAFGDYMRTENIKVVTMPTYGDDVEKTLTALIFANTREQSSKIDNYIEKHSGFYREVVN